MINYNAALPAGNYPASKSSINVTDWIQGIKGNLSYLIRQAFRGGEVGVAFNEFNDMSILFQDAAGTIPVTAVGQPVGLMLDKSKGLVLSTERIQLPLNLASVAWGTAGAVSSKVGNTFTTTGVGGVISSANTVIEVGKTYKIILNGSTTATKVYIRNPANLTNSASALTGNFSIVMTCVWQGLNQLYIQNDSAGTTVIDSISIKELAGSHAYQTVSASRPLLGRHPEGGARNLAKYSNGFSNATWSKAGTTVESGYLAPDGSMTASKLKEDTTSLYHQMYQIYAAQNSTMPMTLSFYAKAAERSRIDVFGNWGGAGYFDLAAGTAVGTERSIQAVGNGWYRCIFTGAPTDTGSRTYVIRLLGIDGVTNQYTGDGVSGVYIWNAQLEASSIATAYQETTTLLDITEKGKASCYYLKFDGVDDFLQTNNIDFTSTDKVSVFAGVHKLSDAATSVVAELSATVDGNTGAFRLTAPTGGGNAYQYISRGSTANLAMAAAYAAKLAAPHSAVITAKSDINADISSLRVNGLLEGTSASDQGTGNYGNHPLYIGRRGGVAYPFNGHLYSLIGIGRLTTDAETIALEKSIAKNTGVTLSV